MATKSKRDAAEEKTEKATAALVEAQEAQLAEKIARQNARFAELGADTSLADELKVDAK